MSKPCGIINSDTAGVQDMSGCELPDGHAGPHEFKDKHGKSWQWETDFDCQCEHCLQYEGDYCTTYWRKEPTCPIPGS